MEQKTVTSIATKKSRDIIKRNVLAEAKGETIDWDKVFIEVHDAEAKGRNAELKAIMEKRK